MTSMSVPATGTGAAWAGRERRGPNVLTAPFHPRTWREHGYLWLVLLVAPFALAYVLLVPSLAAGLLVTVVLLLVGVLVLAARGWGSMYRGRRAGCSTSGWTTHRPSPAPGASGAPSSCGT